MYMNKSMGVTKGNASLLYGHFPSIVIIYWEKNLLYIGTIKLYHGYLATKIHHQKLLDGFLYYSNIAFLTEHRSGKSNSNADSLSQLAPDLCCF